MEVVDTTQINSFAPVATQTDFAVSPSEEVVFILTSGQLQAIIKEAIQLLQDRIGSLEALKFANQKEKMTALESTQDIQGSFLTVYNTTQTFFVYQHHGQYKEGERYETGRFCSFDG